MKIAFAGWFENVSIKRRFVLLICGITVFIALMNAALFMNFDVVEQNTRRLIDINADALNVKELHLSAIQMESAFKRVIDLEDALDDAEIYHDIFASTVQVLIENDKKLGGKATTLLENYKGAGEAFYNQGVTLAEAFVDGDDMDRAEEYVAAIDALAIGLSEQTRQVVDRYVEKVGSNVTNTTDTLDLAKQSNVFFTVIFSLLTLITSVIIAASIVHPIKKTTAMLKNIAHGEGDLTLRLKENKHTEMGELAHWFNVFVSEIQDLVRGVTRASSKLLESTESLSAISDESSKRVSVQHARTDSVATSIDELLRSAEEVAVSASEAAQGAEHARESAEEGQNIIMESVGAIDGLSAQVTGARDQVQALDAKAEGITGIVDVIRNIADQTNLLALNAAIEAARAGEQGRGFSIVADEVRSLAQKTQNSIDEIQHLIEELQQGARDATQVMEVSANNAVATSEKTRSAREALDAIIEAISHISGLNLQIAAATEEQSHVCDDVNKNVQQINGIATDSENSVLRLSQASNELVALTDELRHMISQFRV